ncbi:cbb3-type cytochrome c oxidase subunit I, partial [Acidianus sp. RZ1]|uniref:cbb3-type cytochrome c oxidase subunit I n=1 Tax=Acidianus sp. RZ1 TaxID=1540082 RepID=UPI0014928264
MKIYPKSELGIAFLFTAGALSWLLAMGLAALWFRTILLTPHITPGPNYDPASLYYFLVTFHGQAGIFVIVPDLALAIFAYSLHVGKMNIFHKKLVTLAVWMINLPLIVEQAGGPLTGWYMYPPLALQQGSWLIYRGAMIGVAYFMIALICLGVMIAGYTMFADAYKSRPKNEKIPIFASYTMAFSGMFMPLTITALMACSLWYSLYFWAGVPVNPLTWVVLFWFYGHPVVYYVPFPVFGGLYYLIPKFSGRSLFS